MKVQQFLVKLHNDHKIKMQHFHKHKIWYELFEPYDPQFWSCTVLSWRVTKLWLGNRSCVLNDDIHMILVWIESVIDFIG